MDVPRPGSEPPSSPQLLEEGGEEEDEELSGGEESDLRVSSGRGSLLTRRGITLRVLLKDGLVEPGDGVLSIHYLGKKFVGDLLCDGKIRWVETGQIFNSPSAWATHCKRLVNPAKKSGCGWASVRYRGQKLVQYKTSWLHKYQPSADLNLASEGEDEDEDEEEDLSLIQRRGDRDRVPVRYCNLGMRDAARDPHTLVELSAFSAINRFQPFNVAVSSNVLLLMDFHCHLTTSEVVGYLGGRWDTNTQLLTVLRAFPCRTRLADRDAAPAVEEEICQNLFMRGLSLVGWYHSHPRGPALPSLQDIDSQMDHQLRLQGSSNGFQPCLGIICGPYYHGNQGVASTITPFWVVPPPEQRPNDYGIPVAVEVTYVQDNFLTSDVLNEMMLLVDFYRGAPDLVQFSQHWNPDASVMDKIKGSLSGHAPKDQAYVQILEHVYSQLSGTH
ncbi:MPN domain-containing protein isoform X1 [Clupea harengus]|uniref:MPN domain-containing protein n=1 Tax=Clupea harengus TaxID=7950 RepID=A0A6P8G4H0_CLUHA|nr:MPN domain-containing protein isoform X1 [Clupea harengus]XP_031430458.1 MPN domain-containing protein isoform X1 [Clupea harengus]